MQTFIEALISAYNEKLSEMSEHDQWVIENLLAPEDALQHFGWLI